MKIAHNIKITVFAKEDEKEPVKEAILKLLPESTKEDISKNKNKIEEEIMKGETYITIFKVTILKNRQINEFLEKLFNNLKDDSLSQKMCKRIDERCKCYIRLDKKALIDNRHELTYDGDCVHIRLTIAAYPKRKDNADKLLCQMIEKDMKKNN